MANTIISKSAIREKYESYHDYFNEIIQNVVNILQDNIQLSSQPTYKKRVKSFNSYYKKVLRMRNKNNFSDSDETNFIVLTDMMGIRMICSFLEDLNLALEQIKKLFSIYEIEVKGADKDFSEFGYESIHVLINIPEECKPAFEGKYADLEPIRENFVCEIQIRTILQDAWAEVEHELIYKTEFSPFDKPLRRKLASINASLTLADITFQEIRDYQNKLQKELDDRRTSFYLKADNLLDSTTKDIKEEDINRVTPYVQGTIDDLILRAIESHNKGNLEEAVGIYTRILDAVSPDEKNVISVIRKHRGMAYFSMNKFDDAIEDFDVSIKNDPTAFRSYYYKGIVYSIQRKYKEAVECYTISLNLNQFQAHTSFRRATAYYELQEYEKSMNDLDNAIKLGMDAEECKVLQEKLVKKFGMNL